MTKEFDCQTIWMAALLEGEGHFGQKRKGSPTVTVEMTDEDVVRRLHQFAGVGTVTPIDRRRADWKPSWIWKVQGKHEAAQVMLRVFPYMGHRRQKKILEILAEYEGR